jgi:DNA-directed RNA polymerase specialized sigma24 family protein
MKTHMHNPTSRPPIASPNTPANTPANDAPQELCELLGNAARGDRRAIGAIAIAFGPSLLKIARRETRHEEDAEEVIQDLFVHLLEGRAARFPPERQRDLRWLGGLVQALARSRRKASRKTSERKVKS